MRRIDHTKDFTDKNNFVTVMRDVVRSEKFMSDVQNVVKSDFLYESPIEFVTDDLLNEIARQFNDTDETRGNLDPLIFIFMMDKGFDYCGTEDDLTNDLNDLYNIMSDWLKDHPINPANN